MSGSVRGVLRGTANALGPLLLLFTWLRGDGGPLLLVAIVAGLAGGETAFRFLSGRRPTPYMMMGLAPLLLVQYSSVGDFRIRLACFFMLVYVLAAACASLRRSVPASLVSAGFWRLWGLCFLVFALAATALYARDIHLSGDEPHYVMIAQSLAEDGDFDLKNNLEQKTYFRYLPVEIPLHGTVHEGRYRSFHLPGLSFLLLPFYFIFKLLGGLVPGNLFFRLAAAAINAFFALGLFYALKALWPEKDNRSLFLFFLLTFPLVFHAVHLYPELPAATLLIFAYLSSRGQRRGLLLAGTLLAAIPWLHFKYVPAMLVLAGAVAVENWRASGNVRDRARKLAHFLIPPAVGALLLACYSRALYGSFNPTVISPERDFFAIPPGPKLETLFSFFLDQRDGLLVYAPLFLLLFLAFKKEIRSRIRDFSLLAAMFLCHVGFHAFTTVRGAYSPATRPTLHVLWIMVIFLIAYYRRAGEMGKVVFRLLAGLTAFATVWFFYYPLFLYQPVTRDVSERGSSLLYFLGSKAVNLTGVFPSFLKKPNSGYLPNLIWLAALAIGFVLYFTRRSRRYTAPLKRDMAPLRRDIAKLACRVMPFLSLPLLFLVCFFPHVQLQTRYSAAGLSFYSNSRNFTPGRERDSFKVRAGQDYDLFFDLEGSAARRLELRLINPEHVAVRMRSGRQTLLAENRLPESRITVLLPALKTFSLGKRSLVHVGLESQAGRGTVFFWLEFQH